MKTIKFTDYELVIIRDGIRKEFSVYETSTIDDPEADFNTEKQIEKFGKSLQEIEEKIGYLSDEQEKKVFPKIRGSQN